MSDDGFFAGMAPCEVGTDCTDCGVKVGIVCFALTNTNDQKTFLIGMPDKYQVNRVVLYFQ